jgi:hypothetical protein
MAYAGDVVLIYNDEKPAFFARIDSIKPDIKKGWFVVQFLSLTIPLNSFSWILREEYIHGMPFTMDGKPVKIEALRPLPDAKAEKSIVEKTATMPKNKGKKIIPFRPNQKKDEKGP